MCLRYHSFSRFLCQVFSGDQRHTSFIHVFSGACKLCGSPRFPLSWDLNVSDYTSASPLCFRTGNLVRVCKWVLSPRGSSKALFRMLHVLPFFKFLKHESHPLLVLSSMESETRICAWAGKRALARTEDQGKGNARPQERSQYNEHGVQHMLQNSGSQISGWSWNT